MTSKLLIFFALATSTLTSAAQLTNTDTPTANSSNTLASTTAGMISTKRVAINARALFLKNCAHCHGANADGDDGPDLHGLDLTTDAIANRIRKGRSGQMTAFAGKLQPAEINALVVYVRALK